MPEGFHGTGLMHTNVARLHADHSLAAKEKGVYDRSVGLRAAHEEVHVGAVHANGLANLLFRGLGIGVEAIP